MNKPPYSILFLTLLLIAWMGLTRSSHFGDVFNLPDASLAVFFLAGFYLRSAFAFPLFLTVAVASDYLAISHSVSDWCVTPAYAFLIPTYACLWLAGRWYRQHEALTLTSLAKYSAAIVVSSSLAFLISNASFYLLSGYFDALSLGEYAARVAKYYPPYVMPAVCYLAIAAVAHALYQVIVRTHDGQITTAGTKTSKPALGASDKA